MQVNVKVTLDINSVKKRIEDSTKKGQKLMAEQALKDSNFYAKHDSGEMIGSSQKASKIDKGLLVWDEVYAKRQYYLATASRDKNPQARMMWAHYATSQHGKEWLQVLQDAIDKGV